MPRRRVWIFLLCAFAVFGGMYVLYSGLDTLRTLDAVEMERDEWQRPGDVLRALDVRQGYAVVDLGSGAGYFTLKISPLVGSNGQVLAVDLRRLSLSFLWIRSMFRSPRNIHLMVGSEDDPHIAPGRADAVLIANTYHEFLKPGIMIEHVFGALRSGGRLVIVDRGPGIAADGHEIPMEAVADEIRHEGFQIVDCEDPFIRPPGDDPWWLLTARKP
ncbi:MAG TPA: methyltransferase domain-containing protein [Bryobacteraceae bacterium]|nr:methyltransferase domain-containing protein [Bryobacteraceae bacterium]